MPAVQADISIMNMDVVIDGKIITGVGPEAAKKFGEKLVEVLSR